MEGNWKGFTLLFFMISRRSFFHLGSLKMKLNKKVKCMLQSRNCWKIYNVRFKIQRFFRPDIKLVENTLHTVKTTLNFKYVYRSELLTLDGLFVNQSTDLQICKAVVRKLIFVTILMNFTTKDQVLDKQTYELCHRGVDLSWPSFPTPRTVAYVTVIWIQNMPLPNLYMCKTLF